MIDLLKGIIPSEDDEGSEDDVGRSETAFLRRYDTGERAS